MTHNVSHLSTTFGNHQFGCKPFNIIVKLLEVKLKYLNQIC